MSEIEFESAMFDGVIVPERKRAFVVDVNEVDEIIVICDPTIGGEDPEDLIEAIEGVTFADFDEDNKCQMTVVYDQRFDRADIVMAIGQVLHNMYDWLAEEEYQGLLDKNRDEVEDEHEI